MLYNTIYIYSKISRGANIQQGGANAPPLNETQRFVLASSDQGLKFIRVVNHSAMNNIIDTHNLLGLIGYAKVLLTRLSLESLVCARQSGRDEGKSGRNQENKKRRKERIRKVKKREGK